MSDDIDVAPRPHIKKKVIAISSIKGGVGKTTTTVNLACAISALYKKEVLVIDANLSAPNLGIHLGFIDIDTTIHDVLDKKANYQDALYKYNEKLHVMPGMIKGKFIKKWSIAPIIAKLRFMYDIILIDTSPSLDEIAKVIDVVDEIIFVATPDYPTLSTTIQLASFVRKKVPVTGLILNMVRSKKFELSEKDMQIASSIDVLASVPYDLAIPKSIAKLSPIYVYSPRRKSSKVYEKIAARVMNEELPRKSLIEWIKSLRK